MSTDAALRGRLTASPLSAAQYSALHVAGQFFLKSVSLSAKSIDFSQHPSQEEFGRSGGNTHPLKLEDFLSLAPYLGAHVFDFDPDEVDVWHAPSHAKWLLTHSEQKENIVQAARTWCEGRSAY
jgi:hypothetical protein